MSAEPGGMARISVVIPTLNEARVLGDTLTAIPPGFEEIIVADGGSADATIEIARRHGCRVTQGMPGRGAQLGAGAALATGGILLFLHADTRLPKMAAERIRAALAAPEVVGGSFRLGIRSGDPFLHLVARAANLRTRLTRVPYGDQGVFVRRAVFERLGGFPPLPLMEDVAFGRRLKRAGKTVLLDLAVQTSARRWERENPLFVTVRNQMLLVLYLMGVSPERLVRWYRNVRD